MYRRFALVVLSAAAAHTVAFAASSKPTDSSAPVAGVGYESAFAGYQPFREEKLADWRALNEEVARAGGHVGIFRGAGGHAGHGAAKPAADKPAGPAPAASESGQPPMRGAPKAPAGGGHQQH